MSEHLRTYDAFLKGSVALTLGVLFILVALAAAAFAKSFGVLICWAAIIIGLLAVTIDTVRGAGWSLSVGALVIFALLAAVNIV